MMVMKMNEFNGRLSSSFLLLLFIVVADLGIQESEAVECPTLNLFFDEHWDFVLSDEFKRCSSCAIYACDRRVFAGCPDDFYSKCSDSHGDDVEFIKGKTPNEMEFYKYKVDENGNSQPIMFYISGCGGRRNGKECITDKFYGPNFFFDDEIVKECGEGEQILWHSNSTGSVCGKEYKIKYDFNGKPVRASFGWN